MTPLAIPAEREGGDRPAATPPLGRLQPAARPGLGARPRVRSRCAGGCQRSSVAAPSSSCSTRRSRRVSFRRFRALIGRMRFAHALIREAAYHRLSRSRRVQLHRQVGEALEALYCVGPRRPSRGARVPLLRVCRGWRRREGGRVRPPGRCPRSRPARVRGGGAPVQDGARGARAGRRRNRGAPL